ncbi:aminotransferase class I/II-fold pyridoxal phosphate-dependent enzyme [Plantibacter flavus]|uniref:aminotransferase class I/II-fold pyridoxal phosphate-dependent enzyme n=1 Tax=Plantibacter flavus TaxID=150123 RepID=UPI0013564375|nr:aminotransferase class I/II-fold pyridoxal phosphate-dependent enzyme [Plantibacter flavus]
MISTSLKLSENAALRSLGTHPFQHLAALLDGIDPPSALTPIDLTIGEPTSRPPEWTAAALSEDSASFGTYPPNGGPAWFNDAVIDWAERRFGIPRQAMDRAAVVPTAGAREALFQLALAVEGPRSGRDLVVMPTPHYAPYRAAAAFPGFSVLPLAADASNGNLPTPDMLPVGVAQRVALTYLCSPSNPEGAVADKQRLGRAIEHARRHGYLLVVDECYSEIYRNEPPTSALAVAAGLAAAPSEDLFRNVVVVNSLSKRSSAAGLRVGWVAGDRHIVDSLVRARSYIGGSTPLPNLRAAARLYTDEGHVERIRQGYCDAFDASDSVLQDVEGYRSPAAGMFLWHQVGDGETVARRAWRDAGVRLVPGEYLGPAGHDGRHPGRSHVRLAMACPRPLIEEALDRLHPILQDEGRA